MEHLLTTLLHQETNTDHCIYFQACDLLLCELEDRFDQRELLPLVLALENLIIKAANGESYDNALQSVEDSCYASDLDFSMLHYVDIFFGL